VLLLFFFVQHNVISPPVTSSNNSSRKLPTEANARPGSWNSTHTAASTIAKTIATTSTRYIV